MNTRTVALAAALAAAAPALAAETYSFDKAHSTVGFTVRHIFTNVGGTFRDFDGAVKIDRANLGPCPVCGRDVIENRKGYSCWSKDDPGCGFVHG